MYQEIIDLKKINEELAFKKMYNVLVEYMNEYTCDNKFYLYRSDSENDYNMFRNKTSNIFGLIYEMLYDNEIINDNDLKNDKSIKDEFEKYLKFLKYVKYIKMNINDINFSNKENKEVIYFNDCMNNCKIYLENIYKDMKDFNNSIDQLSQQLKILNNKIELLS